MRPMANLGREKAKQEGSKDIVSKRECVYVRKSEKVHQTLSDTDSIISSSAMYTALAGGG
jgi:hypothetical protein